MIQFNIVTDENHIPEKISWKATDRPVESDAGAILLSVWDRKEGSALRIDLWDKQMDVEEMKIFMHQTLMTLADTFERATNEKAMSASMRDFGDYFAEKMQIRPPLAH